MPKFNVKIRFVFEGELEVNAKDKIQAKEYADKHFGAVDPKYRTTLSDEQIPDWDFPIHPNKRIISIKKS